MKKRGLLLLLFFTFSNLAIADSITLSSTSLNYIDVTHNTKVPYMTLVIGKENNLSACTVSIWIYQNGSSTPQEVLLRYGVTEVAQNVTYPGIRLRPNSGCSNNTIKAATVDYKMHFSTPD